jgi:O-antigen ligase
MAAVPLAQIGAERLALRFADVTADMATPGGRLVVWKDTGRMLAAFPVTGVGFGAFPSAYPAFRSPGVRVRYDQTHNDFLQLAADGGLVAAALLGLALVPLAGAVLRGLSGASGPLAVGLALGVAVAFLHALVDFNFHIPANAATAAILAGSVAGLAWKRG